MAHDTSCSRRPVAGLALLAIALGCGGQAEGDARAAAPAPAAPRPGAASRPPSAPQRPRPAVTTPPAQAPPRAQPMRSPPMDYPYYVKDAVEMTIHLAETAGAGGLYNLGSGAANTWNALATAIFAALGRAPRIEYIPMPEVLRAKYQYFTQADIAKLRASGYSRAVTTLDEAVGDYAKNYLVPGRHLGDEG